MNLLWAILPVAAFYAVEAWYGTAAGVVAGMALAGVDLVLHRRRTGRWTGLPLLMAALVTGLGGMALASDDPRFALWTPVAGDVVLAGLLAVPLALGRHPLLDLLLAQDAELDPHPLQVRFLRGLSWRLVLNLLAHAALTAWAAGQPREVWALVSGPVQLGMFAAQISAEVAWARLVLLPRVDAEDEAAAHSAEQDAG